MESKLLEELTKINTEARLNGATSDLGRTLTAIGQDSAMTLVLKRIPPPSNETAKPSSLMEAVKRNAQGAGEDARPTTGS